jgi:hypothetical protein
MMDRKPRIPGATTGMPLFGNTKDRDAVLARMRGKLASPSRDLQAAGERRESRKVRRAWGWTWKLYLVGAIIALNGAYFGLREQAAGQAPQKRAPVLPGAAALSLEKQALFWTYALYDFDKLRATFGAPSGAVVDARIALRKLEELRPRVDAETRLIIDSYRPARGKV